MHRANFPILAAMLVPALCCAEAGAGDRVDFHESIKPLLAVHCFKCHDAETQKGGLRLDVEESVRRGGESGEPAIVPGASERSALARRISSHDRDERMPPKGLRLSEDEVSLVRRWIDEGATWPARDAYWAFQLPVDVP